MTDVGPSRGHVRVGETTLGWMSRGSGPAVLVAHGLGDRASSQLDEGPVPWSRLAASGRRVVGYDARGHGDSGGDPTPGDYRWDRLARDLLTLADAVVPDEPFDAIGESMGAATLLHAAVRELHRFRSLVLAAPPRAWQWRAEQSDRQRQLARDVAVHGAEEAAAPTDTPPIPVFADLERRPPPPAVTEEVLPAVLRGAADSDLPPPARLAELVLPVLLLAWTEDSEHPLAVARTLADVLPNATLRVAGSPGDLAAWPEVVGAFLAAQETGDVGP